jgi:hypothetical protein
MASNTKINNNLPLLPQQHQIYIQSNQPIFILNTSNMIPHNTLQTTNKSNSLISSFHSQTNIDNLDKNNMKTENASNNDTNERRLLSLQSNSKKVDNYPKSVDQLTRLLSKYKVNDSNLQSTNDPPIPLIITPRGTADGKSENHDIEN